MLADPCPYCGALDCPDESDHVELMRLDMDTWAPDEDEPDAER